MLLPMTDCLRVEGVKNLSDAEIVTLFENDERTGGGQVTRLDRVKGNAVLVYFTSFKDAERVFTRFGIENLPIFQSRLKIFRYYHSFFESHFSVSNENPLDKLIGRHGWPQVSFLQKITQPLLEFVKTKHLSTLQEKLSELATVTFSENGLSITLHMCSESEKLSSSEIMIAHKCQRIIEKFLGRYEEVELDNLTESEFRNARDDENIFIWRNENRSKAVICGRKEMVEKYVLKRNQVQSDILLQPDEYRWIVECGILQQLNKLLQNCTLHQDSMTLHFSSRNTRLVKNKQEIVQRLKNLERKMFRHGECLVMEVVSCETNQARISKKLHEAVSGKVNVIFGVDKGSPYLYGEKDKMTEAYFALSGLILVESAEFASTKFDVSQNGVIKSLLESHLIAIDDKTSCLRIAGFHKSVRKAKEEIDKVFLGQIKWIKVFKTEPGRAEYMVAFDQNFMALCRDNLIAYDGSEASDGKIVLKGQESLDKVYEELENLSSKVAVRVELIEETSIAQFLNTNEAKNILETASKFNSVVVVEEGITNEQDFGHIPSRPVSDSQYSFEIDSLTITIRKGDILDAKSEAIITNVHPSYDLTKGAVSRAVLRRAGVGIQTDVCSQSNASFRVTRGGLLRFKKIFHVIVEGLSNTLVDVLRSANDNKLKSVALPAIGTGRAGISASEMAGNMISVFHDFTRTVPSPRCLKTIDVVISDQSTLEQFLNVSRNLQQGTSSLGSPTQRLNRMPVISTLSNQLPFSLHFGPMKISLRQGDIIDETNDAIVNSVGPNFELTEGMVSKQICTKAGIFGMELRLQLRSAGQGQIQVTNAGKLKCKKIIHIVTDQNMDLKERIVTILRKAQDEKFNSISIPAIGSGKLGLPISDVAKLMRDGFHEFVGENSGTLDYPRIVDIVIFEFSQLESFINGFLDATNGPESTSGKGKPSRMVATPQRRNSATLKIYSESQVLARKTCDQIKGLIRDAYTSTEELEDDMILYRPEDATQSFTKVCKDKYVLWEKSSVSEKAVTLKGPKSFVAEAKKAWVALMKDRADILSDDAVYVWKCQKPPDDWEAVEPVVNLILEEIQQKKSTAPTYIQTCGKSYMLDLASKKLDDCPLHRYLKSDEGGDALQKKNV